MFADQKTPLTVERSSEIDEEEEEKDPHFHA
jgi:hypothetical protein